MLPRQPIKLSYFEERRMEYGGLLNKHIIIYYVKKINISNKTAKTVNFDFSGL